MRIRNASSASTWPDREARLMKGRQGIVAGYNAQASHPWRRLGEAAMLVTAVDVVDEANDNAWRR